MGLVKLMMMDDVGTYNINNVLKNYTKILSIIKEIRHYSKDPMSLFTIVNTFIGTPNAKVNRYAIFMRNRYFSNFSDLRPRHNMHNLA